ncbi:EamA family transporter [Halomarina ordinaria]|uniref:DMT family transporter n=1 Tax=Halomarina ordinaria TaxID=3033939 RepID=A0ABD5U824_9EURY|nr:DMT family transporter [Halomarina sp. PSRA2]
MATREEVSGGETLGVALVVLSAVGFGTLAVLGEYAFAAGLNVTSVLALRFSIAAAVVWPVLFVARARSGDLDSLRLRGRTLVAAVLLGLVGYTGQSALFFLGLERLTAGMTTIVLYTYPVFVLALSVTLLGESLDARDALALPLSLGGVLLITGADPAGVDPRGVFTVLGAAAVYSVYIVVGRVALDSTDGVVLSAYVMPAAALSFLTFGTATGRLALPESALGWAAAVGIAVLATALAVSTFFAGLRRIGASRAGIVSTVEPAVAVVLGAFLLGEPVTVVTVVGGALVLVGVVLVQR